MNCRAVRPRLDAHLDRELDPVETAAVRVHLAECPACRAELESIRSLKLMLSGGPRLVEPGRSAEELLAAHAAKPVEIPAWGFLAIACLAGALTFALQRRPEPAAPILAARPALARPDQVDLAIARDMTSLAVPDPTAGAPVTIVSYARR